MSVLLVPGQPELSGLRIAISRRRPRASIVAASAAPSAARARPQTGAAEVLPAARPGPAMAWAVRALSEGFKREMIGGKALEQALDIVRGQR